MIKIDKVILRKVVLTFSVISLVGLFSIANANDGTRGFLTTVLMFVVAFGLGIGFAND
jgi:hypothetical protein